MVETKNLNEIENIFSQMNIDVASQFSELIKKTILETLNVNKIEKELNYNDIYNSHRDKFEIWIRPKFEHNYKVSVINSLSKIFSNESCKTLMDVKKLIDNKYVTQSSASKAFRVFLNYLDEYELISDIDLVRARKRVKIIHNSGIDNYVPKEKEIKQNLKLLNSHEYPKEILTLFKFMLESGCRFTELKYLMKTFDEENVEVFDNIITYKNFYLRGSKSSFFFFCSKDTFNDLRKIISLKDTTILDYFQRKLHRTKYFINSKYLRKYNFTKLIESNIETEFANFIQGRGSKDIGFTNYLAKHRLTIPKYSKFMKTFYSEIENY